MWNSTPVIMLDDSAWPPICDRMIFVCCWVVSRASVGRGPVGMFVGFFGLDRGSLCLRLLVVYCRIDLGVSRKKHYAKCLYLIRVFSHNYSSQTVNNMILNAILVYISRNKREAD